MISSTMAMPSPVVISLSDAMAVLGMPPSDYPIGSRVVTVTETDARLSR